MKKKTKTILSLTYGVGITLLAAFVMLETFVFPSAAGQISVNPNQNLFDFDNSSFSKVDQSSKSSSSENTSESSNEVSSSISSEENSSSESTAPIETSSSLPGESSSEEISGGSSEVTSSISESETSTQTSSSDSSSEQIESSDSSSDVESSDSVETSSSLPEESSSEVPSSSEEISSSSTEATPSTSSEEVPSSESTTSVEASSEQPSSSYVEPEPEPVKTTISIGKCYYEVKGKNVPYLLAFFKPQRISDIRTLIATNSASQYGPNITKGFQKMVDEAQDNTKAIGSKGDLMLAIDGDFPFWSGRKGYVVRNGVLLRDTKRSIPNDGIENEDLAIFKDGTVMTYKESEYDIWSIMNMHGGCYQNFCFGPALLSNSEINVNGSQELSSVSYSANQRVALGYKDDGTFYFLCSDTNDSNRTSNSVGLSLYHLATIFKDLGCSLAYNLDGGGSANMYARSYIGSGGYFIPWQNREIGDIIYVVSA